MSKDNFLGLNAGASFEGLAKSGAKLAVGSMIGGAAVQMASNVLPGMSEDMLAIGVGLIVAKFIDKEIGLGVAAGSIGGLTKGILGGVF